METTISEKQDRQNRLIIESSLVPASNRRYLLHTATAHMRQLAAEQIRNEMALILVVGGVALSALLGTKQAWESWRQSLCFLAVLLLAMLAGYELKRFRDLRATAAERKRALATIDAE